VRLWRRGLIHAMDPPSARKGYPMDSRRFDAATRLLAAGTHSRRVTLGSVANIVTAGLVGGNAVARDGRTCRGKPACYDGNDSGCACGSCHEGGGIFCYCGTDVNRDKRCMLGEKGARELPPRSLFRPGPRCRSNSDCSTNQACIDTGKCQVWSSARGARCVRLCSA
jgi:hypothetical protein